MDSEELLTLESATSELGAGPAFVEWVLAHRPELKERDDSDDGDTRPKPTTAPIGPPPAWVKWARGMPPPPLTPVADDDVIIPTAPAAADPGIGLLRLRGISGAGDAAAAAEAAASGQDGRSNGGDEAGGFRSE